MRSMRVDSKVPHEYLVIHTYLYENVTFHLPDTYAALRVNAVRISVLQLVGASASECDTIPGRQCMASCFFLLKQFEDVNIYLNSVKVSLPPSIQELRSVLRLRRSRGKLRKNILTQRIARRGESFVRFFFSYGMYS